jgi:hypothetical protein
VPKHDHVHPKSEDLYTPITPEVQALFQRMYDELGSWREVAAAGSIRLKVLRNLRQRKRTCVSHRRLDKLCSGTGIGGVHEFTWFTADDLVALGIWKPVMIVEGNKRIHGDKVWYVVD